MFGQAVAAFPARREPCENWEGAALAAGVRKVVELSGARLPAATSDDGEPGACRALLLLPFALLRIGQRHGPEANDLPFGVKDRLAF